MLSLLIALFSPSYAATYEVELEVYATAPQAPPGSGHVVRLARQLAATSLPDTTVSTAHPNFTCEIANGHVQAVFTASVASWPTSFPATVTCSYGADTLVVHPVLTAPPPMSWDLQQGHVATVRRPNGTPAIASYLYPAGTPVASGSVAASGLVDVTCTSMQTSVPGRHAVQVVTESTTVAGIGTCAMPLAGGGTYTVDVAVVNH